MYTNEDNDQFLPLRETVYKKLRKQILTGELKPGERLMEIHLANKLDVSRTPIREAIRELELEGLVTIIPRSGAQVAQISEKELRDVLEVRRSLDALCSELACRRATSTDKDRLKKACQAFEEATEKGNSVAIAGADVAFHEIITQATENHRLIEIVHNLADQMYRYRFEYIRDDTNYGQLIKEHRALMNAIVDGDAEKASGIAKQHIDRQEESVLRHLREGESTQQKPRKRRPSAAAAPGSRKPDQGAGI
ncbi:MAG: GntR family transcriptional regulator [Lachnospiraceae bacterium]|nr:GntR family transcriptional regulator [Lachnospiraceae bacterium]